MADEKQRELERSMAACDTPEEREALARERCRAGLHTWSDWEMLGRWVMFADSMGRRQAIECGYVQREVRQRVCWWCFRVEHKRVAAEELAREAGRAPMQAEREAREVARQELSNDLSSDEMSNGAFLNLLCPHGRVHYHCGDCATSHGVFDSDENRCHVTRPSGGRCHLVQDHNGDHVWELPF